jgi:hypothetical protein
MVRPEPRRRGSRRTIAAVAAVIVTAALGGGACLGTTPEEELADSAGPDQGEEGPTHRPGQPCLVCHGEDYSPGGPVFVMAGTVYLRADDADGLEGAEVEVTDAEGAVFSALTNRTGNFMMSVGGDDEPEDGWVGLARPPVFPVRVLVRRGASEKQMRNVIHREGSCAFCHDRSGPDAASAGKVFVEDVP